MLTAFLQAFRTPDLRKKLLFTLGILAVFRLGAAIPTPGISEKAVQFCTGLEKSSSAAGVYQLVNLFSGGALLRLSVFALGIMPYITASIILQLLAVVIPRLETLRQEGQAGQAKITQYTRYLTIGLAILQSTGIVAYTRSGNLFSGCTEQLIPNPSVFTIATMVITMTSGTAVIMWLGELITDRGVGNGMSVLIFTTVISQMAGYMVDVYNTKHIVVLLVVALVAVAIVAFVVFMEQAQRRIPVQYAKRVVGRKVYGGQATYLPLRVNTGGVIPVIFAGSVVTIPTVLASMWPNSAWVQDTANYIKYGQPLYYLLQVIAIVFFSYFYISIIFNPVDLAENMRKYGGFIPGIRPGKRTSEYIDRILTRITLVGSLYLAAVCLLPEFLLTGFHIAGIPWLGPKLDPFFPLWFKEGMGITFYFGGTSLLIVVGVAMDTIQQVESQLVMRNYEGFMKRSRIRGRRA